MQWLAVALGGALGAMLRFAVTHYMATFDKPWLSFTSASSASVEIRFPVGTIFVNISGAFLMGIAFVVLTEKALLSAEWRLFFITGVLGGYTTFSAFSLEMFQLWQAGHLLIAAAYALSSVLLCVLMTFLGMLLAQRIF